MSDLEKKVEVALDEIRPMLVADGGNIELDRIEGDVVYVRLLGACHGCPSATATMSQGVEKTIRKHCPEVAEVRLAEHEPAEAEPAPAPAGDPFEDREPIGGVKTILAVPEGMKGTWAAANAMQLEMKLFRGRGNDLACGDDPGDLAPPFALALEASKKVEGEDRRIIVLGVGLSFIEPYLTQRIPRLTSGEALATDPPPINDVELVINSAYHLIGQPNFIAAGPSVAPRIQHLTRGEEWAIKGAIGLGWPLLVMAAGVVVVIVRKR